MGKISRRGFLKAAAAWIGMKLKRKLTWDPATKRFIGDDAQTPGADARRANRNTTSSARLNRRVWPDVFSFCAGPGLFLNCHGHARNYQIRE